MKRSNEFDCEITEYERTNPVRHVQKYAEYSGIIQENSAAYAQHLFEQGYVVFPTAYTGDLRNDLETEFLKMPEFKQHLKFSELNTTQGYICGATSFTSNPSVFHNATSRKYRQQTTASLMPIFQKFVKLHGCPNLKLRTGSDRIQVRGKGRKPGAEGWHRDINPSGRRGECSIGGWGNADDTNQYFCGIKGTHSLEVQDKKGFASIKGPEIEKYKAMMLSQVGTRNALGIVDTDSKGKIIIPPNHSILFFANMVHAVNPTKAEKTSVKQFDMKT